MRSLLAGFILLTVSSAPGAESWRAKLTPPEPGPFPIVRSFQGEFRFGWSDIAAATARARVFCSDREIRVDVEGGTTGLARTLWKLDATHHAIFRPQGFESVYFRQVEKYRKKTVKTEAVFKPDGVWRQRDVTPDPKGPAKWKRIKVRPIRDIVAAMFFVRSQPLQNGETVGVIAFPGDDAYLAEITVAGRESLKVNGQPRKAIKLDFTVHKVVRDKEKKEYRLERHKKFRTGSVWISDDLDRVPLRAEVNIFIGYVFGELTFFKHTEGEPKKSPLESQAPQSGKFL